MQKGGGGHVEKKTMRLSAEGLPTNRVDFGFPGAGYFSGTYHTLLSAHHLAGDSVDCPGNLEPDGKITILERSACLCKL